MSNIIGRWAHVTAKIATQAFELSSTISDHGTIIGDARESFIRNVLCQLLPETVHVGTGQVVDHLGTASKQIDVVLYRKDFPILRTLGQSNVYLVEGVLATIEVKSKLTKAKLWDALQNGKSVRNLRLSLMADSYEHYAKKIYGCSLAEMSLPKTQSMVAMLMPPHYVFGYRGYDHNQLHLLLAHIDEWFSSKDSGGECDASTLPEVVSTFGCVGVSNIGNTLKLPNARHAFAVSTDDDPLKALLPILLLNIVERTGWLSFGATRIGYDLTPYLQIVETPSTSGWHGCAEDMVGIHHPKLYQIKHDKAD